MLVEWVGCMALMQQIAGSNPVCTDYTNVQILAGQPANRTGCSLVVVRNHAYGRYNLSEELTD